MSDPMQEIRASFFVECEELLEALQDGLIRLEAEGFDAETVNVVFRAVHSIKGGAGAFALDQLVGFAHVFETLLDELRGGRIELDPGLVALFFRGADRLSDLVRAARDETSVDAAAIDAVMTELEARASATSAAPEEPVAFVPAPLTLDLDLDLGAASEPAPAPADPHRYLIRFAPEQELFATGSEPLFLFRALSELGTLRTTCHLPELPDLAAYVPTVPLLSWELELESHAGLDEVREVFDFVEGLCKLTIGTPDDGAPPSAEASAPAPGEPSPAAAPLAEPAPLAGLEPTAAEDGAGADGLAGAPGREDDPRPQKSGGAPSTPTVRVDLDRIERLVNLVGELVINQAMLSQSMAEAGIAANPKIASGLDEFLQLTRDIQDGVMMIRAQPVKSLFQRMGRIVRESSAAVGKSVRLVTEGEATEIDKTMIERLSDPLTHMIRNAVDHGLEDAATRMASGKPRTGTITLTAAHRSGRVVIEVADDGAGINRPKVQSIAEQRGLIAPGLTLSDAEIDNLLFLPGFSTAGKISNLSGRGVGMDVVKSAISALGGRIGITSVAGKGATFSMSLPLTLAVLDGMVVRAGGETLVVPLSAIVETLTVHPQDLTPVGAGRLVMRVRDSFVPLIDLAERLGYQTRSAPGAKAIALLIARDDGARAAVIVEAIVDQRQVVIKGLEDSYGHVPGVAAATILGDGRIALILDPSDLMERHPSKTHLAKAG